MRLFYSNNRAKGIGDLFDRQSYEGMYVAFIQRPLKLALDHASQTAARGGKAGRPEKIGWRMDKSESGIAFHLATVSWTLLESVAVQFER